MTRTINGDRIKEPYNNMVNYLNQLKEILKNHDKFETKMKDFDYFTVELHP